MSGAAACARPAFVLPSGPGVRAPEARALLADATRNCREVRTLSGELRLSGRVGSAKIGGTRILAGLTSDGSVRFEVPAPFGRPVFVIAGTAARATLLSRDNHSLNARADEILDAFVGLRLGPDALVPLLAGCGGADQPAGDPQRFGDTLTFGEPGNRVFVSTQIAQPRVVAAEVSGWVVEYLRGDARPTALRVRSAAGREPSIELSISLSQVEVNVRFPPAAFTVSVPPDAIPVTLAELRASGPLGDRKQ